jgi:Xaa-Pro aminopeptidase
VSPTEWSYQSVPETSVAKWLQDNAPDGARIGYDPWLHTSDWVKAGDTVAGREGRRAGGGESATRSTPVWADQPQPSKAHLSVQSDRICRQGIGREAPRHGRLAGQGRAPMRRCWRRSIRSPGPFNVRGHGRYPHAGWAGVCHGQRRRHSDLFVEGEKVGDDVRAHLGNGVRLHERYEFEPYLKGLKDKLIAVDPERSVAAITQALEAGGASYPQPPRPGGPAQGDQEFSGSRRPQGGTGARRRRRVALPEMDRGRRAQRAKSTR